MLNISDHNKHIDTQLDRFKTVKGLEARPHYKILNRLITLVNMFITLFLPWTQNISGKGAVTTLKPNHIYTKCHLRSN
jgi:hypothetical protein